MSSFDAKNTKIDRVALSVNQKVRDSLLREFSESFKREFGKLLTTQQWKSVGTSNGVAADRVYRSVGINSIISKIEIILSDSAQIAYGSVVAEATTPREAQPTAQSSKQSIKVDVKPKAGVEGALPPPATYAAAVLRSLNEQKAAAAKADKKNRAAMAQVSEKAAEDRKAKKELALKVKYAEGYVPLADRKKLSVEKTALKKDPKPATSAEKVAKAAHSFVRFTRAQMKGYQAAFVARTGAEKWFSAAERAAYKQLSPAEKKKIRVENHEARIRREQQQARDRQKFRKERQDRIAVELSKRRVEERELAERLSSGFVPRKLPTKSLIKGKGRQICTTGHRMVTNAAGSRQQCRDCGALGTDE
jgi:DNA polymerase III gamma/tau subunit